MPDPDTTHEQRMAELGHDWEPDGYYQHCRRCETVASRGAPLGICPHKDRLALAYLSELHARAEQAEQQVSSPETLAIVTEQILSINDGASVALLNRKQAEEVARGILAKLGDATAKERERCARVCEEMSRAVYAGTSDATLEDAARRIREGT